MLFCLGNYYVLVHSRRKSTATIFKMQNLGKLLAATKPAHYTKFVYLDVDV